MNVLIVHAHPEPNSFNGAMTRRAAESLANARHVVAVSDLYAMAFDPVSDRRNFRSAADPHYLRLQNEEAHASESDGYVPTLQAEMDKLLACDLLIFQFPVWWLGPPAILKGWIDRVFAVGRAYGGGRYFEEGVFGGKRAMCSVTVGGPRDVYAARGVYAELEDILFPIHRGLFAFTGFSVVEPFVVYAPNRIDQAERRRHLDSYAQYLLNLDAARMIPAPKIAEYECCVFRSRRKEG